MNIFLAILSYVEAHPELVDEGTTLIERLVTLFEKHPAAAAKIETLVANHPAGAATLAKLVAAAA
jgi:hypothetical protein